MNKQKFGFVLLACLLSSSAAFANHHEGAEGMKGEGMHHMHEGGMPPMFGQLDKNNDGRISRDEARESADRMFTETDINKDGFISKEEMQAHHKAMREKHMGMMQEKWKAADKDGDGALSRAEAEAGNMPMLARNFDKLDKNKDGKLTPDEIRDGMPKHPKH